jgi:hypothetical protein
LSRAAGQRDHADLVPQRPERTGLPRDADAVVREAGRQPMQEDLPMHRRLHEVGLLGRQQLPRPQPPQQQRQVARAGG